MLKRKYEPIISDVDPVAFGGFFKDTTNGNWIHLENLAACEDREPKRGEKVVERRWGSTPTESDLDWITDWPAILACMGLEEKPADLYLQLHAAASYHGWDNFDSYPYLFTEAEAYRRYTR